MEIKIRKLILPKSFSNFVAGKAVLIEKAILYLDLQMIIINMKLYPAWKDRYINVDYNFFVFFKWLTLFLHQQYLATKKLIGDRELQY